MLPTRVITPASSWPLAGEIAPDFGGPVQVVAFIALRDNCLYCSLKRNVLSSLKILRGSPTALVTFYKQSINRKSTRKRKLRTTSFKPHVYFTCFTYALVLISCFASLEML